jgi:DNA helicase IV
LQTDLFRLKRIALPTESTLERELAREQAHIDLVVTHLRQAMASAKGLVRESKARYVSDRDSWLREEHGTALFERDAFAFLAARRLAMLDGEHEGLVFGRLDFTDQDPLYVGRLGVRTDDYEPLVIDWRAKAAAPFYRATPAHPMDVVRRRVITSRDDKVTGIEDDVLLPTQLPDDMAVVGDGALMRALERARGRRMHDIVATIQAEQDEAIRAPYQGFTIITGGPGTGKTVVALHRVAFLLYTHRRRFTNGGVLVIGPSPVFMDYIERVLPSLGEDAVTLKAVGQVADDVLGFSAAQRGDDAAWVIKGELNMVATLRRLVERCNTGADLSITVKGEPLTIPAQRLAQIRRDALARHSYHEARPGAEAEVVNHLAQLARQRVALDEPGQAEALVRNASGLSGFMDQWWPSLDPPGVLARLADPALARSLGTLSDADADRLAASIDPGRWSVAEIPRLDELAHWLGPATAESDPDPVVFLPSGTEELVTLSDRLTDQRQVDPGAVHSTYAHILVDEAQDLTPMQWRMIHRRGPNASWTIVGDPAQTSWPDPAAPGRALADLIGARPQRGFTLTTNYRSPREAYDLATAYIRTINPGADIPRAVRDTGVAPLCLVADRGRVATVVAQWVARLLAQVEGTVGVIADPVHTGALAANPRVICLDAVASKGLEFDAVLVVDPDGIADRGPAGPRALYVALTRPTQMLVTLDLGGPGRWRAGFDVAAPPPAGPSDHDA